MFLQVLVGFTRFWMVLEGLGSFGGFAESSLVNLINRPSSRVKELRRICCLFWYFVWYFEEDLMVCYQLRIAS